MISGLSCDTNIFVYSIDRRDPVKHLVGMRIASECIDAGAAVSLQCLNEFFRAVTSKGLLGVDEAKEIVQKLCRSMAVYSIVEDDLTEAIEIYRRHKIQFFDALLIATLSRAGCTTLISEDMQHGQRYGSVTVLNPFKLAPSELDLLLA